MSGPIQCIGELRESWHNGSQSNCVEWIISEGKSLDFRIPGVLFDPSSSIHQRYTSPRFTFANTLLYLELSAMDLLCLRCVNETRFPLKYSFGVKIGQNPYSISYTVDPGCKLMMGSAFRVKIFLLRNIVYLAETNDLTFICKLFRADEKRACGTEESTSEPPVKRLKLAGTDTLSENLKDLFVNKIASDTVLRVKGKKFQAHRAILIARSSVFAAMFQHDTSEKQTGIININDCDPGTFQGFLEYLYSGRLGDISVDTAIYLYKTSDKYDVQELKDLCVTCMMGNLTVKNVCDVVILADQFYDETLFSAAQTYFNENHQEIYFTKEWENLMKKKCRLANKLLIQMSGSKKRMEKR